MGGGIVVVHFEVIPSIDILDGQCVRLAQGSYQDVTVYAPNPADAARRWAAHAISRFHVVDLDGAREGVRVNVDAIREIVEVMEGVPVQLGGGIRSIADVEAALALGVDRVVMGTIALKQPQVVREAAQQFPGRVVLGIDAKDGQVAVEGWVNTSEMTASDMAKSFEDSGVAAIVYTDIGRDGMLTGANLEATEQLAQSVTIPVIVSGGVASIADIEGALARRESGIMGAILGRSLYTGAVDLAEALRLVGERESACS